MAAGRKPAEGTLDEKKLERKARLDEASEMKLRKRRIGRVEQDAVGGIRDQKIHRTLWNHALRLLILAKRIVADPSKARIDGPKVQRREPKKRRVDLSAEELDAALLFRRAEGEIAKEDARPAGGIEDAQPISKPERSAQRLRQRLGRKEDAEPATKLWRNEMKERWTTKLAVHLEPAAPFKRSKHGVGDVSVDRWRTRQKFCAQVAS